MESRFGLVCGWRKEYKVDLANHMPHDFDTLMTAFWIGFACVCASLISRHWTVLGVFIFCFVFFPSLEMTGREVLHTQFAKHPERLWALKLAVVTAYVLAVVIAAFRIGHYSSRAHRR